DRVSFSPQRVDQLLGEQAHGAVRAAVIFEVALAIALQPVGGDQARRPGELRHTALRGVDRDQRSHYRAAITARVTSAVLAFPPRSGVKTFFAVTVSIAFIRRAAAFVSPRCSSIIDAVQNVAIGLATPLPVMSNAEPWIGSNIEGKVFSGLR